MDLIYQHMTYIDKNIRIYDKYKYTVSGTYVYNFVRKQTDTNIYTLEMPFGSFTTEEIIVCKNNKFEYGRYNTTSTNLKLFRPLLLTTPEGQKDENGKAIRRWYVLEIYLVVQRVLVHHKIYMLILQIN